MALFIMRLVVCWALLALPTAARAQRAGPDGIVVLATQTLTGGGSLRIAIPDSDVRAYAVRIAVVEGTLDVQRVIISYANGQTHFEDRPVKLGAGRSLSPIDERAEARQIESVELVLAPGARLTTPVKVEVSAITRMPVDAHAKPKPPAREPVADASTASPPASRPRTTRGFSSGPAADDKPYTAVPVFFGTDRRKEADRSK